MVGNDTEQANPAMSRKPSSAALRLPARIGVLEFSGAQQAAVHGLMDFMQTAARLDVEQHALRAPRLAVQRVARRDLRVRTTSEPGWHALILPPSVTGIPSAAQAAPWRNWLIEQHARGTRLCSVCAGAFVLAETGLLDGRRATTHWALEEHFAMRFPHVRLDTARLLIEEPDLITAGGVMAWMDLSLRLIEQLTAPAVMLATARMFLVDPAAREQSYYASHVPRVGHGDAAILRVQQWLQERAHTRLSLETMARRAQLGERTFLRRFQSATGQTPIHYVQQLRVARARELLERSALPVDEVAWKVGYEDPGAFRKVFLRIVGLSPAAYRTRFTSAGRA